MGFWYFIYCSTWEHTNPIIPIGNKMRLQSSESKIFVLGFNERLRGWSCFNHLNWEAGSLLLPVSVSRLLGAFLPPEYDRPPEL